MGVGVYESNFSGTGGTFLVDGPLLTDEDYEAYCDAEHEDGMEPCSFESWAQMEYDDFSSNLIGSLKAYAREIGLTLVDREDREWNADHEFVSLAVSDHVAVGCREWENDVVIGVWGRGPVGMVMGEPEAHAETIIEGTGMSPAKAERLYFDLSYGVQEYIRLRLMQDGFQCRYKTSGYTSEAYTLPEDADERIAKHREMIPRTIEVLSRAASLNILEADREERVAIAKAICEINEGYLTERGPLHVQVPVYDRDEGVIRFVNPHSRNGLSEGHPVPDELADVVGDLKAIEHLAPIPRNERTESWFRKEQKTSSYALIVDAEEQVEAAQDALLAVITNDDRTMEEIMIAGEEYMAPAPSMQ